MPWFKVNTSFVSTQQFVVEAPNSEAAESAAVTLACESDDGKFWQDPVDGEVVGKADSEQEAWNLGE